MGLIAACAGYALFWSVILPITNRKHRFWIGTFWLTAVHLVQLSWFISHPYWYIYVVYVSVSFMVGLQFGLLCLMITPQRIATFVGTLSIAAAWTLLEWVRIFFMSGFSWNPAGLALTGSLLPMQMAAIWGVFGLSFWVMYVNLLALRFWNSAYKPKAGIAWVCAATLPYLFGAAHLAFHAPQFDQAAKPFTAVMVQPAFDVEEGMEFHDAKSQVAFILDEWRQLLQITQKHHNEPLDLIVLPEFVVPFNTFSPVYEQPQVAAVFAEVLGPDAVEQLPTLDYPLAYRDAEGVWWVSNAYWAQGIANCFDTGVIVGLEDADDTPHGEWEYFSAAVYFQPNRETATFRADRYEKRVLVPMGEYLPFSFAKALAAKYGVTGSFTPGKEAKVFDAAGIPFGISICYEETFSDLMRESRQLGAEVLVNLTSDVWYPNSRLPQQHFDHARLRTVESGIPLIRACNTGVTGALDSLGRVVALLGDGDPSAEWTSDSIKVHVPRYHYQTLYSRVGDSLIIGFCLLITLLSIRCWRDT